MDFPRRRLLKGVAAVLMGLACCGHPATAGLTPVSDFGSNPTSLQMLVYEPAKLASKPAVILAVSIPSSPSDGTRRSPLTRRATATSVRRQREGYVQMSGYTKLADDKGFLVIYPSTTHDNHVGGSRANPLLSSLQVLLTDHGASAGTWPATGR